MVKEYKIGKVIAVLGDKIDISLYDFNEEEEEDCYGVPEDMCVDLEKKSGAQPVIIGQPGSFVQIGLESGVLLALISEIKMRERTYPYREIREADDEDEYIIDSPKRILTAVPIGTINPAGVFEKGTDVLPTVNRSVFAVTDEIINKIYTSYIKGDFKIGKLSLLPTQDAKIDLDVFLSRHATIVGQTGCGKSWTVASIIQKISKFPKSTVILFDLHGEYKNSFNDEDSDYIDVSELEFPYWLMNFQELVDLMIDRSESNAPNQIAKFRDLLQEEKETNEENIKLNIPKITLDTPVFFDFDPILEKFRELNEEMVKGSRGLKQGDFFGKFGRMLMRIDSRLNDRRFDLIFKPKKYTDSKSLEFLFRKILGEEKKKPKKIVIIDISPIPIEVRNSIISLILRSLFDFSYWFKRVHNKTYPIAIFCDEAHAYLNDRDPTTIPARKSAEKIAKEGRKYGISLTVITQRPREVSSTILSQCNSFMCHRIMNPDDQSYVKSLLPDSIRGIVNIFSSLRIGECILLGDSVIMPTRIKIDPPNPTPSSESTSFIEEWNKEHEEIDINKILDSWRKQED